VTSVNGVFSGFHKHGVTYRCNPLKSDRASSSARHTHIVVYLILIIILHHLRSSKKQSASPLPNF
jgi:hypothetical protein